MTNTKMMRNMLTIKHDDDDEDDDGEHVNICFVC